MVKERKKKEKTHNLIISSTRIISPSRPLHNPSRHRLKIKQIITLPQQRHLLDPFLAFLLLGILGRDLPNHGRHVHRAEMLRLIEVLLQRVRRVNGFEFLRRVLASVFENDFHAAWVFREEVRHVVGPVVDDDPAVLGIVVLGDFDAC